MLLIERVDWARGFRKDRLPYIIFTLHSVPDLGCLTTRVQRILVIYSMAVVTIPRRSQRDRMVSVQRTRSTL